jgi:nucleoside-diphosphate-sugar epimerase
VRTILVAIPPVTHSERDKRGFIPTLIDFARSTGVSAYVGDGSNRWPAGHVLDIAHLFRLALEKAPAGSQLYAATEEGIPLRLIAETIGRHLDVPAVSIAREDAAEHFKNFLFVTLDITMANTPTRELLGWTPAHSGLIDDLDQGHYFTAAA